MANNSNIQKRLDELKQANKTFTKTKYFSPKDGPNTIRIIPPFGSREDFWVDRKVCYKCGPKGWKLVPKFQFDQACEVREYLDDLETRAGQGDDQAKKELEGAKPSNKAGIFVIDRANEKEGPLFWEATPKCLREVLTYYADPEYGNLDHAEEGFDLVLEKTPKNKSAKGMVEYAIRAKRKQSPLGTPEQVKEWLKEDLFESQVKWFLEGHDDDFVHKVLTGAPIGKQEDTNTSNDSVAAVYYVMNNENYPDGASSEEVQKLVDAAGDATKVDVCKEGHTEWATADFYGFKTTVRKGPPVAKKGPPVADAPPAVNENADDNLRAKLEKSRAARTKANDIPF